MALLEDINPGTRERLIDLECPTFPIPHWSPLPDLTSRIVSIVSSAGIHTRDTPAFRGGDGHYATIADKVPDYDVVMSHVSVNFDRTGFERDLESILPRRALHKLADAGQIGAVAKNHYSFMGATDPREMEAGARELGERMKAEGTDTVLLIPV
ncbi:MAG: selenoprotein B glycine/betaine/sarcosine/D-proline reductase [Chromatiales bacterium]|jgi:D-proline reductase (dithiol) PrdB|nr:selenoprotein B glycine/betaine/sarcosine/D-proline reductase [Chromatiales bacterium]